MCLAVQDGRTESAFTLAAEGGDPFHLFNNVDRFADRVAGGGCALSLATEKPLDDFLRRSLTEAGPFESLSADRQEVLAKVVLPAAAARGNAECVRLLLDYGVPSAHAGRAMIAAGCSGAEEAPAVIEILLAAGAPVDEGTLLTSLARSSKWELLLAILKSDRHLNYRDVDSATATIAMTLKGSKDASTTPKAQVLIALLERGALAYQPVNDYQSPYDAHGMMSQYLRHFSPASWALHLLANYRVPDWMVPRDRTDSFLDVPLMCIQMPTWIAVPPMLAVFSKKKTVAQIIIACCREGKVTLPISSAHHWAYVSDGFSVSDCGEKEQGDALWNFVVDVQKKSRHATEQQVKAAVLETVKRRREQGKGLPFYGTLKSEVLGVLKSPMHE
jgi:hypothetical protein